MNSGRKAMQAALNIINAHGNDPVLILEAGYILKTALAEPEFKPMDSAPKNNRRKLISPENIVFYWGMIRGKEGWKPYYPTVQYEGHFVHPSGWHEINGD